MKNSPRRDRFLNLTQWTGFYMITTSVMKELRDPNRKAYINLPNYFASFVKRCKKPLLIILSWSLTKIKPIEPKKKLFTKKQVTIQLKKILLEKVDC